MKLRSALVLMQPAALRKTPLNEAHRAAKARMVDFGGWDMPVQYTGLVEEHLTVRNAVGLFDVSHMGEIDIRGPEAEKLVEFVSTNHAAKLKVGQAQYAGLLYAHGGFVDDILVHKVAGDHFFLCVNASNQEKDFLHILAQNQQHGWDCEPQLSSDSYAQIAIQGPYAKRTLQALTGYDLDALRYYWFADDQVADSPARIAHTGYTGEDGFEIYVPPSEAPRIWAALLQAGAPFGIKPCGLGARNTLRLEAKMALYGHEIHASINPFEADLGWIVKMDKGDFLGRAALEKAQAGGIRRKLVGFEMRERGIGRDGYEVMLDGESAGWVTSGSPAPSLNKNIGLCYLPSARARAGQRIEILVRNQPVAAETVDTPFYKRPK